MTTGNKAKRESGRKKTVLVVDDELDMRSFLSTLVKLSGYEPSVAKNGKDGIRKAEVNKPDLLILDVMMPGEGGVLMYYHLNPNADLRDTPVIMLSAIARKTFYHYLSMLNIQMDVSIPSPEAYIEKPPDAEELMELMKSILEPSKT